MDGAVLVGSQPPARARSPRCPSPDGQVAPLLAVPFWRAGRQSGLFQLNAWEVLADPGRHADHWQRTMAADLSYPLTAYRLDDRASAILASGSGDDLPQLRRCTRCRSHFNERAERLRHLVLEAVKAPCAYRGSRSCTIHFFDLIFQNQIN